MSAKLPKKAAGAMATGSGNPIPPSFGRRRSWKIMALSGFDCKNSEALMCNVCASDFMIIWLMCCAKGRCALFAEASGGGTGRRVVTVGGWALRKWPKALVGRQLTARTNALSCMGRLGIASNLWRRSWYLVRDLVRSCAIIERFPIGIPASLKPTEEVLEPGGKR